MDLSNAEVTITTQSLIDIHQGKGRLFLLAEYGDMGEFLSSCSEQFSNETEPQYRYLQWEDIPETMINREWLSPNFFELRDAMEQLEEADKDCFLRWCERYGYDITSEDPFQLVSHYLDLYGSMVATDEDTNPDGTDDSLYYFPGASSNFFDTGLQRFEVFDENYD